MDERKYAPPDDLDMTLEDFTERFIRPAVIRAFWDRIRLNWSDQDAEGVTP